MDALVGILVLILGILIGGMAYKMRQAPTIVREVVEQPVEIQTQVAPYWTAYGLPEYWPSYLSPYWYYDVPYYGPITGTSGYYPSRHQWSGGRANYMPHGWGGRHPIGGASGVAVGGGGGGGHGGH